MVVKRELPAETIVLDCTNQSIVGRTVRVLKSVGMDVEELEEDDLEYPYLYWTGSNLDRRRSNKTGGNVIRTESPQVFINYLLEETIHELWI